MRAGGVGSGSEQQRKQMLVSDKDAIARLSSSSNLANRLKNISPSSTRKNAMSLFIKPTVEKIEKKIAFNPFENKDKPQEPTVELIPVESSQAPVESREEPRLENLINDHEAQVKLGLAHDQSLALLSNSVKMLTDKLDEVSAAKLPGVITAASRVVESIRKERLEISRQGKDKEVHIVFYTPEQRKLTDYAVIDVGSIEQPSGV